MTNVRQSDVKKWISDTLKDNTEFADFCTQEIGSALNFYRSSPINDIKEEIPYMTVFSDMSKDDNTSEKFFDAEWMIPISMAILDEDDPIDDNGVQVWESVDKIENIAHKAIEILECRLRDFKIKNEDILIVSKTIYLTETGEAEDVQANIMLQFGKVNSVMQ